MCLFLISISRIHFHGCTAQSLTNVAAMTGIFLVFILYSYSWFILWFWFPRIEQNFLILPHQSHDPPCQFAITAIELTLVPCFDVIYLTVFNRLHLFSSCYRDFFLSRDDWLCDRNYYFHGWTAHPPGFLKGFIQNLI